MRATAECIANIGSQHPDIGALAAGDPQCQRIAGECQAFDGMNGHRPRLTLNLDTLARQFVEWATIPLQCRMHGRNLLDSTGKLRQHIRNASRIQTHFGRRGDYPFGIAGVGRHPQLEDRFVGLVSIEQVGGKLGRLAEAQRQQPGGQRIEGTGMPPLGGGKEPTRFL
ncbi:hypothetical protein SDC9_182792 [bioreactor metagenome]|uniref:Uncharacterized protein n=1 Tax=bioreactor metagenome TaxID=1076179 RepID=A0A645H8I4_9ZZZZ